MCMPRPACQSDRPAEPPPDPPLSLGAPSVRGVVDHASPSGAFYVRPGSPSRASTRHRAQARDTRSHLHARTRARTHASPVVRGTWRVSTWSWVRPHARSSIGYRTMRCDAMRCVEFTCRRARIRGDRCGGPRAVNSPGSERSAEGTHCVRWIHTHRLPCCWSLFLRGEMVGGSDFGGADSLVAVFFFTEGRGRRLLLPAVGFSGSVLPTPRVEKMESERPAG